MPGIVLHSPVGPTRRVTDEPVCASIEKKEPLCRGGAKGADPQRVFSMHTAHRIRRAHIPLIVAFAAVLAAGTLSPADAAPATDVPDWQKTYNRMVTEIMSPYCHGLTLDNCPTQGASDLRNEIKAWLMAGRTEDWVLNELELRFGPSILGAPRWSGMGLLAWLAPPVFFFFGTIGVVVYLRRNIMALEDDATELDDAAEIDAATIAARKIVAAEVDAAE